MNIWNSGLRQLRAEHAAMIAADEAAPLRSKKSRKRAKSKVVPFSQQYPTNPILRDLREHLASAEPGRGRDIVAWFAAPGGRADVMLELSEQVPWVVVSAEQYAHAIRVLRLLEVVTAPQYVSLIPEEGS